MFSSVKIIPELFEFGDSKFSWVGNFLFFANLNIPADFNKIPQGRWQAKKKKKFCYSTTFVCDILICEEA